MSELKETEIGLIPKDWAIRTIDEIKAPVKHSIAMGPFGSNITKDNFVDEGIPVIRGNNLTGFYFWDSDFVFVTEKKAEQLKASQCRRGDIVITHRGTLGQVGYIPEDSKFDKYIVSQSGMKLTVDENIVNSKFVFFFLKSKIGQYLLLMNTSQTGVPAIAQPTTSLKKIPVPIPPKEEVEEINKTLSSIQGKIGLLRRQNDTLEKIAQTLFKRWFVEFEFPFEFSQDRFSDSVQGELFDFAQSSPNEAGKPYKSSGGKMMSSELGEIPAGWRISKIGNEVETLGGGTPSTKESAYWENGTITWYSPTDLTKNSALFSLGTEKQITELGLQKSSAKLFPVYSLLMTSRATIGEITINTKEACTNQGFITIIPNNNFPVYFLHGWLKTQLRQIHNLASGSTFPEINKTDFRNLEVIVPTHEIMGNYKKLIKPIYRKIENNIQQIQTLTRLRDTLLPKLMSGKIRTTGISHKKRISSEE